MMEIKQIDVRQYDLAKAAAAVQATAFRYSDNYQKVLAEIEAASKQNQLLSDPTADRPSVNPWGAFLDDQLIAMMYVIDFQMVYEAEQVKMAGIGGVASKPEFRRRGAIREIMQTVMQKAHQEKVLFSYLYPFSFPYYHQFGYDFGCRRILADIPFRSLLQFAYQGSARLAEKADWPAIKSIYEQFSSHTNGAVVREEKRWSGLLDHDPYLSQRFTYIWQDDSGRDRAYFVFTKKQDPDRPQRQNSIFQVLDWAVTDPEALKGMFGFMARFESQYEKLQMIWPLHLPLETLFDEINPIKRELQTYGQIRVVHVKEALQKLQLPSWLPQLECRIAVNDGFLPQNTGVYQLALSNGGEQKSSQVSFSPQTINENTEADLYIDAPALSSLLLGSRDLAELSVVSAVRLSSSLSKQQAELLMAFFCKKQACIYDYF